MGAKTSTGCEVLSCLWFSQLGEKNTIGIVLVQCERYKVAYVGTGLDFTERGDAIHIAEMGARLPLVIAAAAFKGFDLSDYKPS